MSNSPKPPRTDGDTPPTVQASPPVEGHTPGPWEVMAKAVPGKRVPVGKLGGNYGDGRDWNLRITDVGDHGQTLEEIDANARLVAAAPDLLAALKELVTVRFEMDRMRREYSAGTCNAEDAWGEYADRVTRSDAAILTAIAKAEGRA